MRSKTSEYVDYAQANKGHVEYEGSCYLLLYVGTKYIDPNHRRVIDDVIWVQAQWSLWP